MEVINERIGVKLGFEKAYENQDDDNFAFYRINAVSTTTDCTSEDCYSKTIRKHEIGDILSDFLFSNSREDASKELEEINEIAVIDYICNRPNIVENIITSISLALTEDEKVLVVYGEANCRYHEMLEYADVSQDLHKYARVLPYHKAVTMTDYEITRYFVMSFLNTLQRCSLDCKRENPFAEELQRLL